MYSPGSFYTYKRMRSLQRAIASSVSPFFKSSVPTSSKPASPTQLFYPSHPVLVAEARTSAVPASASSVPQPVLLALSRYSRFCIYSSFRIPFNPSPLPHFRSRIPSTPRPSAPFKTPQTCPRPPAVWAVSKTRCVTSPERNDRTRPTSRAGAHRRRKRKARS